jgi:hypothetical protein
MRWLNAKGLLTFEGWMSAEWDSQLTFGLKVHIYQCQVLQALQARSFALWVSSGAREVCLGGLCCKVHWI